MTCLVLAVQSASLNVNEDVKIAPKTKDLSVTNEGSITAVESKIYPKLNINEISNDRVVSVVESKKTPNSDINGNSKKGEVNTFESKVVPNVKTNRISSKDAESIIEAAMNKKGANFETVEEFSISQKPEKVLGKAVSENVKSIHGLLEGGINKHAVQNPNYFRANGMKAISTAKNPLVSRDKILDMKKSKEIKFIVNNKKTTNFEVSTIKNEIYGRGNIRLKGNGDKSTPKFEEGDDKWLRTKEPSYSYFADKNGVPVINMNVHNLNAPNEGLIYVNNPLPSAKAEHDQNYVLVNVSGEPALIPSILLNKAGFVPKENTLNYTGKVTGLPIFNFWPENVKIPHDNIVPENHTLLENLKCSKPHLELSKENFYNLAAYLREGLSIPTLPNGCYDWNKINNYVSKLPSKEVITSAETEKPSEEESFINQGKKILLNQLHKYRIPVPRNSDGSVNWDEVGRIVKKLEYDSTTQTPIVIPEITTVTEYTTTPSPDLQKQYLLAKHSELGLPLPQNPDGSLNWNLMLKHLIEAATNKNPVITPTTTTLKPNTDLENEKEYLLKEHSKLGIPIPKKSDGSIDWPKIVSHLEYYSKDNPAKVTIKPRLTPQEQEISDLYSKLGLQLPKKSNGNIDWEDAYKYLASLQDKSTNTEKPKDEKIFILQEHSKLGVPIPKLPNGDIDWVNIQSMLNNAGTTEAPIIEIPTTESPKGVIVLGKTNLLSTFQKLGLPIPRKADGSFDWDAIIKYLMEHGYKIETGKISGNNNLINMGLGGRLDLLQRLQNLGLPIPKLSNGQIDWTSIYQDLISNEYNIENSDQSSALSNINNLGIMDRLKLLEKLKNSGISIPKLANGNLDWIAISKYFANDDGSLNLKLINRMSVQDRLKLLNQLRNVGIPLYRLPNGQYDWSRILQAVNNRGLKVTGTVVTARGQNDIGNNLSSDDKMQLLREITRLRLPVPSLPGGGIDWNGVVREVQNSRLNFGLKPRPGLLGTLTNLVG